jgi:hypothetical protein
VFLPLEETKHPHHKRLSPSLSRALQRRQDPSLFDCGPPHRLVGSNHFDGHAAIRRPCQLHHRRMRAPTTVIAQHDRAKHAAPRHLRDLEPVPRPERVPNVHAQVPLRVVQHLLSHRPCGRARSIGAFQLHSLFCVVSEHVEHVVLVARGLGSRRRRRRTNGARDRLARLSWSSELSPPLSALVHGLFLVLCHLARLEQAREESIFVPRQRPAVPSTL